MNLQDSERDHERALTELRTMASRNVDPATLQTAVDAASASHRRLQAARNQGTFQAAIDHAMGGMTTGRGGEHAMFAEFGVPPSMSEWLRKNPYRRDANWGSPAFETRATTLTEGSASGGALVVPDYRPTIVPLPLPLPTVASLLSEGSTISNAVSYPREKSYTNAAATVAESGVKPESALVFEQVTDPVTVIAHWLPVTEQLLEDSPALAAYLNARLGLGVELTEADQLLNGDGVGSNILGLLHRTGLAPDQPRGTDTNADAIAKQMAAIQASTNLVPTGIVIHPSNFESVLLAKDTQGRYIGLGPGAPPQIPSLWGKPVAVTKAIAVGTALIVCRSAAMVLRRTPLTLAATNSHSDFFIRNLVAIRAEQREALAVMLPQAFGTVSGLN
jgi:HK97 family phage major capsid protein